MPSEQIPSTATAILDHGASADQFAPTTNAALLYLASLQSLKSQQTMRRVLNQIAQMAGHVDHYAVAWQGLRRELVFQILQILSNRGRTESTRNLYLAALKGVAKEAYLAGQMPAHEYERVRLVKSVKGQRLPKGRDLPVSEISQLMDHCLGQEDISGIRDAALLALMFGCGPRRSEVVSLNLADIDIDEASIRVIGKGSKERSLAMPARTLEILGQWMAERGDWAGPLFVAIDRWNNVGAKRLTDRAVYDIVKKRVSQVGLANSSPHNWRRAFITFLLNEGVDIATVASMAGHSYINTTRLYARQQEGRNREAAAKIVF